MNIIEVEGLKKSYGEIKAVDDISFSVERGSLFAFLGVNGAGKSTTINILCSTLKKDAGKVTIGGFDLDTQNAKVKTLIGNLFQGSVLDNRLTVEENLRVRASLNMVGKKDFVQNLNELAEALKFSDILKRKFSTLSGGQKRRIDIARALISKPEILFLDEPTTGLDPSSRVFIWQFINKLREENKLTIFLTTHYMEETVNADKVTIIDSGKISAAGTPHELKNKFSSDYIKMYLDRTNETDGILIEGGYEFTYTGSAYSIKIGDSVEAKKFIEKYDSLLKDFEVIKGDMDDVFLNVTGKKLQGGI